MWICDVDAVHSDAMKIKETREYLVIRGVFWRHIGAIFLPKNTEGRCGFVMLMLYILTR